MGNKCESPPDTSRRSNSDKPHLHLEAYISQGSERNKTKTRVVLKHLNRTESSDLVRVKNLPCWTLRG